MTIVTKHKRIAAGGTVGLFTQTLALKQLVIVVSNAGTTWQVRIEDLASTPRIVLPSLVLTLPATGEPIKINYEHPLMLDGLRFITESGTFGAADVWFSYAQQSTS
jgi:hypothetical protein